MSVTAEQWAQPQPERQRQADKVQTLINVVRRGETEQNNNLLETQRLRTGQAVSPPANPRGTQASQQPIPALPTGRGLIDTRVEKLPACKGDESPCGDWSFQLRSKVSVVDFQLCRMMEEPELAAHANACALVKQDMDPQLGHLLVMWTSGSASQIIRQLSGVQAFRDLA